MPLYLIQAGGNDGPVKIGVAKDILARLTILQAGNHLPLRLIGVKKGKTADEKYLHWLYRHLRIRGEWFAFDETLLAEFDSPASLIREVPTTPEKFAPILAARNNGKTFGEIASMFGVSRQNVHQIVKRFA